MYACVPKSTHNIQSFQYHDDMKTTRGFYKIRVTQRREPFPFESNEPILLCFQDPTLQSSTTTLRDMHPQHFLEKYEWDRLCRTQEPFIATRGYMFLPYIYTMTYTLPPPPLPPKPKPKPKPLNESSRIYS